MESKITDFGSKFAEKSSIEIEKENRSRFVIKTEIKYKINLLYDSKLKSNSIRR